MAQRVIRAEMELIVMHGWLLALVGGRHCCGRARVERRESREMRDGSEIFHVSYIT